MSNPFEDMAEQATRKMRKRIERQAIQPMVPTPMEKAQYDKNKQLQLFKKWKREIREGMSRGIYGTEIITLLKLLRKTPDSTVLVQFVQKSKWLLDADIETKYSILGYIGDAMIRWNIRHGLPPMNDSLPDEPDTPFIVIRKLLMGV